MRNFRLLLFVGLTSSCNFTAFAAQKNAELRLPNGIIVTRVTHKTEDLARLMDAHLWKFQLRFLKPIRGLDYTLQVREKGKAPLFLGGGGDLTSRAKPFELTIGVAPIEMDFATSKQMKISCWGGGFAFWGSEANPFRGALSLSDAWKLDEFSDAIPLMKVQLRPRNAPKIGYFRARELTLVLQIKVLSPIKVRAVEK